MAVASHKVSIFHSHMLCDVIADRRDMRLESIIGLLFLMNLFATKSWLASKLTCDPVILGRAFSIKISG